LQDILENLKAKPTNEGVRKCPACAELVKEEAIVCRYCKSDLPKIVVESLVSITPLNLGVIKEEKKGDGKPKFESVITIVSVLVLSALFILACMFAKGCSH
jgi:hypothetical protein